MKFIFNLLLLIGSCGAFAANYFPSETNLNDHEKDWFSKHLYAAKEKLLPNEDQGSHYRFIWLRTFHNPVIIRVDCLKEECKLTAKMLSGKGGYSPGTVSKKAEIVLGNEELLRINSLFSKLKNPELEADSDIVGMDGSVWVLESQMQLRYQVWKVWSPVGQDREIGKFVEFCEYLLDLSKFEIPQKEFY